MKFGIAPRLFIAVFLSFAVLGVASVAALRWSLSDGDPPSSVVAEPDSRSLIRALEIAYRTHGNWAFLPIESNSRREWLRTFWRQASSVADGANSYGDRIAILDANGRALSGIVPSRLLRAIGSIDTRQIPLIVNRRTVGYLVIAGADNADDKAAVAFLLQRSDRFEAIAAAAFLLAVILAVLLAMHFRRPIRRLVDGARLLEAGRFDTRLDDSRRDELGELASAFNHLAARLEDTELARRQWVADTSHELRTPLAVLHAQVESLQDGIRTATAENLGLMLEQVETMTRRVDDLHQLARADMAALHYERQRIDLWPLVQPVVDAFRERATAMDLTIITDQDAPRSVVVGDAERMRQVLVNLVENALRYTDPGGQVRIRGKTEGRSLLLIVEDSAPGVPSASLKRLGERFFRTDEARAGGIGGAGLGLALARQIVEAHEGQIDFAASSLGGLQVTIKLPLVPE